MDDLERLNQRQEPSTAPTTSCTGGHHRKYPTFELDDPKRELDYLSLDPLLGNYDYEIARKLISGGYPFREQVKRFGGLHVENSNRSKRITVLFACTEHTATQSSLRRCVAAAGVYLAEAVAGGQDVPRVRNPFADNHNLAGLYDESKVLYYLYNIGLQYEVKHFLPECLALLAWRQNHYDVLFKTEGKRHLGLIRANTSDLLKPLSLLIECEYKNTHARRRLFETAQPYINMMMRFQPRQGHGRPNRVTPRPYGTCGMLWDLMVPSEKMNPKP